MSPTPDRLLANRRGIALPLAIFALVVVGGMVAGTFFVGMQEQRIGRNSVKIQQAFQAAETGAQLQAVGWNAMANNQMAVGSTTAFAGQLANNTGWYRGDLTRLSDLLYLVRSEGFSRDSSSRSQVGLLLRLRPLEFDFQAGLETQGEVEIGGNARISGIDTLPENWDGCPAPSGGVAGLRISDTTDIDYQGNNYDVDGDPAIEEDATINDSTLTTFGDQDFDDLEDFATVWLPGNTAATPYRVEPSLSGTQCDTSDPLNWGEPHLSGADVVPECQDYFPIVWVDGDAHLNQRRGQSVLIVNGDLYVAGLTELYGPVIVRGRLIAEGGGSNVPHFYGGIVVAGQTATDSSRVAGNAEIYYSSCAIQRALSGGAPAELLRSRSWVNLF